MSPNEFSLRELELMAHGRISHHWDLFAPLMCFVANPHMPKGKPITVRMLHPFQKSQRNLSYNKDNWLILKGKMDHSMK
jgi:hypothetical protein